MDGYRDVDMPHRISTIKIKFSHTMIKVSEELLNDSVFGIKSCVSREFVRRIIGAKEEEAFFNGGGSGKPLGVLAAAGGAQAGVTAPAAAAVTDDERMD